MRKVDTMILSTRGRYGIKMMLELALNYGKGAMPLKILLIDNHYQILIWNN